ncbi:MAG: DUF3179 domain-containing protein [Spirochaetaceae bacterium]|nr:MAG: DUF3179 domain-containing protein [Spirochaetaceae bacterium]
MVVSAALSGLHHGYRLRYEFCRTAHPYILDADSGLSPLTPEWWRADSTWDRRRADCFRTAAGCGTSRSRYSRKEHTGMKKRKLLLVVVLCLAISAVLVALGRNEESSREADAVPSPSPSADNRGPGVSPPPEEMRRLTAMSARFGPTAGVWTEIELPSEHQNQTPERRLSSGFSTDFSRALISYNDIIAGGPPKDGIPSIDNPHFISVREADSWLAAQEPVILYRRGNVTRIYPLQVLTWHEIVNDTVSGHPVAVTYCPLCNTGMVFDRRFAGETLEFGVSGRLIYSNMIMYDRSRESWWIQATGQSIAGYHAGQQLRLLPSSMLSWADVREFYPDAEVLSRETGYPRDYGRNPYAGYDTSERPFLYQGPDRVPATDNPMERVLSVYHEGDVRAVMYSELSEHGVMQFSLGDAEIVVFWSPGTASALDTPRIPDGRDVGSATAFYLDEPHQSLVFERRNGTIVDTRTGSHWHVTGLSTDGQHRGVELRPATAVEHFRFSWEAFHTQP